MNISTLENQRKHSLDKKQNVLDIIWTQLRKDLWPCRCKYYCVIFIKKHVLFLQTFLVRLKNKKRIKERGKTGSLAHTILLLCCSLFWDESHSTMQRFWDQATYLLSKTKRLLSRETRDVFMMFCLLFVSCLLGMCIFFFFWFDYCHTFQYWLLLMTDLFSVFLNICLLVMKGLSQLFDKLMWQG